MGVKQDKNIVYRDASELPMHNFNKVRTEGNFMWMVVGYDGYHDVEVPENATEVFEDILNRYCELMGNNKTLDYYETVVSIANLECRYVLAYGLLECLYTQTTDERRKEIIDELHGWGFLWNDSKPFNEEMERMKRQLRGAKTRIEVQRSKLKKMVEASEGGVPILKQKIQLEQALKRPHIDLKITTVEEWCYLCKQAEEVAAAQRKWQNS